jgi:multidrug resistance efflux pump
MPEKKVQESNSLKRLARSRRFQVLVVVIAVAAAAGGIIYLQNAQSMVYIEKSGISAPVISLAPASPGFLDRIYVSEGSRVLKGGIIAQVSGQPIRAPSDGIILSVQNTPGGMISSQNPVATMLDPRELRVVGHIDEDKGLSDIKVGQNVTFTVDAFGQKVYRGTVESVSPTSRQQDIVFSISDQRAVSQFDVKVKFDTDAYPELKNGMSARMWVQK